MKPFDAEKLIANSECLTRLFGYWPRFHDAEIIELNLWRGDVRPAERIYVFPTLTAKIHVWELADGKDDAGLLKRHKHTLVVLTFRNIEDISISGFNHHNAIEELRFAIKKSKENPDATGDSTLVSVEFAQSHGVVATFRCFGIEVLSATPCNENGLP